MKIEPMKQQTEMISREIYYSSNLERNILSN